MPDRRPFHVSRCCPWTFTAASSVELTITDALLAGDSFDVYDSGTVVGSTPSVLRTGSVDCGLDPSVCVLNPDISHGEFLFASGPHSLMINVNAVQILGEGFVRVDPVPDPGTLSLLLAPLLLLRLLTFSSSSKDAP